jgi:hypothetical protein
MAEARDAECAMTIPTNASPQWQQKMDATRGCIGPNSATPTSVYLAYHYCVAKDLVQLREDGGWQKASECERYTKLVPKGYRDDIVAFWDAKPLPTTDCVRFPQQDRLTA